MESPNNRHSYLGPSILSFVERLSCFGVLLVCPLLEGLFPFRVSFIGGYTVFTAKLVKFSLGHLVQTIMLACEGLD